VNEKTAEQQYDGNKEIKSRIDSWPSLSEGINDLPQNIKK